MEHSVCDQFSKDIDLFVEWIKTQPQLPQNISNLLKKKTNQARLNRKYHYRTARVAELFKSE